MAVALTLVACDSATEIGPVDLPQIEIGLPEYAWITSDGQTWEIVTPIEYEFVNRTEGDLYFRTHCETMLQVSSDRGWRTVWGGECLDGVEVPVHLEPGERFAGSYLINYVRDTGGGGSYRLRFDAVSDRLLEGEHVGRIVREDLRTSEVFTIHPGTPK